MNSGAQQSQFSTQPWGENQTIVTADYILRRVEFFSGGSRIVGNLFFPKTASTMNAVVIMGLVAYVKEQ